MKNCRVYHFNPQVYLIALTLNILLITMALGAHHEAYKVVHGWPTLPENDALGEVTGVGVDSHNRVFITQRG